MSTRYCLKFPFHPSCICAKVLVQNAVFFPVAAPGDPMIYKFYYSSLFVYDMAPFHERTHRTHPGLKKGRIRNALLLTCKTIQAESYQTMLSYAVLQSEDWPIRDFKDVMLMEPPAEERRFIDYLENMYTSHSKDWECQFFHAWRQNSKPRICQNIKRICFLYNSFPTLFEGDRPTRTPPLSDSEAEENGFLDYTRNFYKRDAYIIHNFRRCMHHLIVDCAESFANLRQLFIVLSLNDWDVCREDENSAMSEVRTILPHSVMDDLRGLEVDVVSLGSRVLYLQWDYSSSTDSDCQWDQYEERIGETECRHPPSFTVSVWKESSWEKFRMKMGEWRNASHSESDATLDKESEEKVVPESSFRVWIGAQCEIIDRLTEIELLTK